MLFSSRTVSEKKNFFGLPRTVTDDDANDDAWGGMALKKALKILKLTKMGGGVDTKVIHFLKKTDKFPTKSDHSHSVI